MVPTEIGSTDPLLRRDEAQQLAAPAGEIPPARAREAQLGAGRRGELARQALARLPVAGRGEPEGELGDARVVSHEQHVLDLVRYRSDRSQEIRGPGQIELLLHAQLRGRVEVGKDPLDGLPGAAGGGAEDEGDRKSVCRERV